MRFFTFKSFVLHVFKLCLILSLTYSFLYICTIENYSSEIKIKIPILRLNLNKLKNTKNFSIFCIIKTRPESLLNNKTLTVYRTWAYKCDNYRFISVIPKELKTKGNKYKKLHSKSLEISEPFYVLQPKGLYKEIYGKLTDKLYSTLEYIYVFFNTYDWYYIVDDDAYVNMENLVEFLKTKNSSYPVTYGHDFKVLVDGGFHSGGCGYVISKESFIRVSDKLIKDRDFCPNSGIDDLDLNACFRLLNVYPNSSLDEQGRERFLPVHFTKYYIGPVLDWLYNYSQNTPRQVNNDQ